MRTSLPYRSVPSGALVSGSAVVSAVGISRLVKSCFTPPLRGRKSLTGCRSDLQVELAERRKTVQPSVSAMENAGDNLVSTVRSVVENLGGHLEMVRRRTNSARRRRGWLDTLRCSESESVRGTENIGEYSTVVMRGLPTASTWFVARWSTPVFVDNALRARKVNVFRRHAYCWPDG